jgi:6-pyruvoyl-tetrahydropterin synthase
VAIPDTSVTRTYTFEAAHRLARHPGKCRNLRGRSYRLDVTVAGADT